jgi:glycosyltransferase involved in cell wall biosynthesis
MKLMASRLHIHNHVMWLGKVELKYLRGWYAAASVLALPSLHEGFGKVIAEAYLMDTPVVVTPFVSAEELVMDGKTGFVVPFRNEVALAAKLGELLDDRDQARAMGQQGRQHILDYYPSEKEYIEGLMEIWDHTAAIAVRSD